MSIIRGFFTGIRVYGKALDILFHPGFRWFLLFPLLFLLLIFWGGEWLVSSAGDSLSGLLESRLTLWLGGISWLSWLSGVVGFVIKVLLKIAYFFVFLTFGGYLLLIVMSPVYSWLSERTEAHLTGRKYPFSFRQLLWEMSRGILIALRNMIFQVFISLVLLLCSFIPLVGLLSPFAMFLVSAYFYGFSFIDYAVERKKFNVKQSVRYMNKNAGLVTGIGTVFALSLLIPWISIVVCSFVSLLSVIAGTVFVYENEKEVIE